MRAKIRATIFFLGMVLLAVGCARTTNIHRQSTSSSGAQAPYVKCVGKFIDYEADYSWFEDWVEEDGTEVHDDGRSPRATFRILAPAVYADRIVGVLYKYEGKDLPPPPALSAKGKEFSFELPKDFFTGKYVTIDNIHVRNLTMEPYAHVRST